jgi:protein TonB
MPAPAAAASAISNLSPAELLSRSAVSNSSQPSNINGGRRVTLTPNMKDYRYSQYLTDWRLKVERIGAMNYPEEARGRFFGSLVLSVALRPDGSVDRIIVVRSSGNKVLDDAAKRIVMMSSPFAPFPPDIRKETDFLDITRTWTFTRGDALETR